MPESNRGTKCPPPRPLQRSAVRQSQAYARTIRRARIGTIRDPESPMIGGMLETPLFGKFQGENKRLVFSAHTAYLGLIRGTVILGVGTAALGVASPGLTVSLPEPPEWFAIFGTMFALAGVWAAMSLQFIAFDLKERTYRRRQGPGFIPRTTRGSVHNIEAMVLLAEDGRASLSLTSGVTYRLALYWRGNAEPPMVLDQETVRLLPGAPLNYGAARMLANGVRYAQTLGLPFFDNSFTHAPCPVAVFS